MILEEGYKMEKEIAEVIETGKTAKGRKAWLKIESEYVRLRQAGESIQALSDSLYVDESQCLKWERLHSRVIEQSRFIQTGKILREKKLTRQDRINTMSKILDKINSEIEQRDFSTIPTDKLIILGVKMSEILKNEIEPIRIDKESYDMKTYLD